MDILCLLIYLRIIYILQGWYKAKVTEYNKETDNAKLEFDTEKGNQYIYSVEKEAKAKRLKLAKSSQRKVDNYEHFFEIGTIVEAKWSNEEAAGTSLLQGKYNWQH